MYIIIIFGRLQTNEASLVAQTVKSLPAMQETWIWSLGWEDPLEKEMATHSSTLAWEIAWTEEANSDLYLFPNAFWRQTYTHAPR